MILTPPLPPGRPQGAFDTKDATGSAHAGITQAAAYYPYDPTLGQYQYDRCVYYPYDPTLGQYQYDRCVFCVLCPPLWEPPRGGTSVHSSLWLFVRCCDTKYKTKERLRAKSYEGNKCC